MILIGMYDSPFVRRVGIALRLYGLEFEHRPWSVFGDAEAIAEFNPLRRVPTLVLDDGEVLIETPMILDALDEMAGPDRALAPRMGPRRREAMKLMALSAGMADKAVSWVYEREVHGRGAGSAWIDRCRMQISAVLDALEHVRAAQSTPYWGHDGLGHADIALACGMTFIGDALKDEMHLGRWSALLDLAARCEAQPAFAEIRAPFSVSPAAPRANPSGG